MSLNILIIPKENTSEFNVVRELLKLIGLNVEENDKFIVVHDKD